MFCFQTFSSAYCDKTAVCTPDKDLACFLFYKISLCLLLIAPSFKIVLKCAYKLPRCLVTSNRLGMLAFREVCVSIYVVYVDNLIVLCSFWRFTLAFIQPHMFLVVNSKKQSFVSLSFIQRGTLHQRSKVNYPIDRYQLFGNNKKKNLHYPDVVKVIMRL